MKKRIYIKAFALLLLLNLMLTACSSTPKLVDNENHDSVAKLSKNYTFTMGTASSGGSVYAIGAGLSKLLTEKIDGLDIRAMSTGGAVDNIGLMERNEVQFAVNASNANYLGYNGKLSGMGEQKNLKGIVSLYPSVFHFIVSKNSSISSFGDLKGTKGAVGASASATDLYTTDVLNYYGYDYKNRKDVEPVYASTTDATDLFKDDHIDWAMFALGVPGSAVIDLTMANKINFLPIEGSDRDGLLKDYPYYIPYTIPKNTYNGFDQDIDTIACVITLAVDESVDEEVVYQITKVIWESIDDVKAISNSLEWMSKENATSGIGVDLHPGALKYYKEIGLIK